ncbi:MAG TPA: Mpo1-like protein [Steroidobacteraceae bacterium]|nr:Mpo1-like protein [Steroidobacteraceae bacterium]
MRTVAEWLGEYGASHQNPTNKLLHWLCVPPIVLSVMGLLWSLPVPAAFLAASPWLNWATLAVAAALVYYFALSAALAAGALLAFLVLLAVTHSLAQLPWPLWLTSLAIFVVAWIGQFVGHAAEGKRPSFFKDVQFLLIGPLWLLAAAYRRFGLPY